MKKLTLMTVLLLSIGLNLFAQSDIITPTKSEELASVQVINAVFDRTTEAVEQLSSALKVPAEHVYNVLVKPQSVNSVTWIIVISLILLISLGAIFGAYYSWTKANLEYSKKEGGSGHYRHYSLDDSWWSGVMIAGIVSLVIIIIVLLCTIQSIVTGLVNPEYGAIRDIMSIL